MCMQSRADCAQSSQSTSRGYPNHRDVTGAAIQLALLFIPPEVRFQLQLFTERAQEIVANAKQHIRPEKTLELTKPSSVR